MGGAMMNNWWKESKSRYVAYIGSYTLIATPRTYRLIVEYADSSDVVVDKGKALNVEDSKRKAKNALEIYLLGLIAVARKL